MAQRGNQDPALLPVSMQARTGRDLWEVRYCQQGTLPPAPSRSLSCPALPCPALPVLTVLPPLLFYPLSGVNLTYPG